MTWHLYFNHRFDSLVAHVCDEHRDLGQRFECPDSNVFGDCEHVQTRPCDCWPPQLCAACTELPLRKVG